MCVYFGGTFCASAFVARIDVVPAHVTTNLQGRAYGCVDILATLPPIHMELDRESL